MNYPSLAFLVLLLLPVVSTFAPFVAPSSRRSITIARSTEFDDSSPSDSSDETFEEQQEQGDSTAAALASARDRLLDYVEDEGSECSRGEVETLVTR